MTNVDPPILNHNVGRFVAERARETPRGHAVVAPVGDDFTLWTWQQLHERSGSIAHGLLKRGLRPGDRACVFVRPGLEWIALVHGLFQLGAVPVLIDPGMGRRALLECVRRIRPRALIAVPRVHFARLVSPSAFESVEIHVWAGQPSPFGACTLAKLLGERSGAYAPIERAAGDEAAILFTSGSTGPAKGVVYEHGMFNAQVGMLRKLYEFQPGTTDLACFPLFALFGPALGLTSVFPAMDFARPADVDPARIVTALQRLRVRSSFGSPAIWRKVVPWCETHGVRLESLRQLMIAGAPIEADLVRRARALLSDDGEVFTPYGATEALPVAHVAGRELAGALGERAARGAGTAVGRPVPGVEIRLIAISDEPILRWSDDLGVPTGEAGEICVRGANVTRIYKFEDGATAGAKIADGETFWINMCIGLPIVILGVIVFQAFPDMLGGSEVLPPLTNPTGPSAMPPLGLGWSLITLPILFALQATFTVGLGYFLAALNLFLRDVYHLMGVFVTVWMFATPIFYPPQMVADKGYGWMLDWNPMHWLITSYREILIFGAWPDWMLLGRFALVALLVLFLGSRFFLAQKPQFPDLL